MPALTITPADLAPFAEIEESKAEAMIEDALALAGQVAPCLTDDNLSPQKAAAAKAILRRAILRWNDQGSGAVMSQTALAFGQTIDTRQQSSRGLFWPSEITDLQDICKSDPDNTIWSYDMISAASPHAPTCAANLGANYCDCGVYLTGTVPLWNP